MLLQIVLYKKNVSLSQEILKSRNSLFTSIAVKIIVVDFLLYSVALFLYYSFDAR